MGLSQDAVDFLPGGDGAPALVQVAARVRVPHRGQECELRKRGRKILERLLQVLL
jgi:hypothetical protein